jgi:hypothetical protein
MAVGAPDLAGPAAAAVLTRARQMTADTHLSTCFPQLGHPAPTTDHEGTPTVTNRTKTPVFQGV